MCALKIVRASDPISVEHTITTIYGPPGLLKTSLAFTADAPLLLDFDEGVYRAVIRGDSVPVSKWEDVASMTREDFDGFKTAVVDTVGRALDKLSADIIRREAKLGRAGSLTLQGYGQLKSQFAAWLKLLRSFGLDVVLIAHMDETKDGDETRERIDAQGASKNEVYKCSDAMGRVAIRSGSPTLLFSPTDAAFGKNPAGLGPIHIPNLQVERNFLGGIIRQTKEKLNRMSDEQRETAALMATWNERVEKCTSAIAINRIQENAKRLLASFAKDRDFVFDKKTGGYKEAPAEMVSA